MGWNDVGWAAFNFEGTFEMPLEGGDEEAVGGLVDIGDLHIFGQPDVLPFLCVFDLELGRVVGDAIGFGVVGWGVEVVLAVGVVDEFEGFGGVVEDGEGFIFVFDLAVVMGEDDGGRAEELAGGCEFFDFCGGAEASVAEVE
jgi:hypothetical protein